MKNEMKTLCTLLACIPLLAACNKEERAPVTADSAVVAPADTTATAPAATVPPATQETVPATAGAPAQESGLSGSSAAGATEGSGGGMYVVERGDTLWGIAEKNGISHGDLAKWNNISDPRELKVGREIRLSAP